MTKQDVIKAMKREISLFELFAKYCVHNGATPDRVNQLIRALHRTNNTDFVNNLLYYTFIRSQIEFEINILVSKNNQIIYIF